MPRLLEAYRRMTLIRAFEERVSVLYRDGEVPGFVHLSIGQEACAAGACLPLAAADVITSNHRGHGHCLAKGLAPEPMMAELNGILGWIEQLQEVDVEGVEPMTSVVAQKLKMRDDVVTAGGDAAAIVANAPLTEDNFFVVRKVVE